MVGALAIRADAAGDVIRAGDGLIITVWNQPALSGSFVVEGDGAIVFPLVGRIDAAGLTVRDLEAALAARLSAGFVRSPQVSVVIEPRVGRVLVTGEVRRSGAYRLTPGLTLADALALAGWLTPGAAAEAEVLRTGHPLTSDAHPDLSAMPVIRIDTSTAEGLAPGGRFVLTDGDIVVVRAAPTVHVTGSVVNPGEYAIEPGMRVVQVLARAGGLSDNAADDDITIVRSSGGVPREQDADTTTRLAPGDVVLVGERGALRFKPRVGVVNIGYDSNIHHAAFAPQDDSVATIRGGLDASSTSPHLAFHASGTADYQYFHQHADQRSVNAAANGRVEAALSKFAPYGEAAYERGLAREQLDMHRRLNRTLGRVQAGGAFGFTRNTSLTASARLRRVDYIQRGTNQDLGTHSLDRDEEGLLLGGRTALSALTTIEVSAVGERARFFSATERDSTTLACVPGLVFRQDAAVSGRLQAGYKQVTFEKPPLRNFRGVVADVALSRPVTDRTRLTVSALRDFRYSADRESGYYTFSTAGAGIGQWLTATWRLDLDADYKWLRYDAVPGVPPRTDDGYAFLARLGRQTGAITVEIGVTYERRRSELARERFTWLLAGMSVIYAR